MDSLKQCDRALTQQLKRTITLLHAVCQGITVAATLPSATAAEALVIEPLQRSGNATRGSTQPIAAVWSKRGEARLPRKQNKPTKRQLAAEAAAALAEATAAAAAEARVVSQISYTSHVVNHSKRARTDCVTQAAESALSAAAAQKVRRIMPRGRRSLLVKAVSITVGSLLSTSFQLDTNRRVVLFRLCTCTTLCLSVLREHVARSSTHLHEYLPSSMYDLTNSRRREERHTPWSRASQCPSLRRRLWRRRAPTTLRAVAMAPRTAFGTASVTPPTRL